MSKQTSASSKRQTVRLLVGGMALAMIMALTAPSHLLAASDGKTSAGSSQSKVDINRAGVEELESLPRIGPALARRIIDYRKQHGPFKKTEDLLAVKGIGPKLLAKIRDRLVVGTTGKKR